MTTLNRRQTQLLLHGSDWDMPISEARSLLKAVARQEERQAQVRRKRTTGNIFTTLSGRAQPRQGFLSLEIMRAIYMRSEVVRACIDTLIEFVCAVQWTIKASDSDKAQWLKKRRPEKYADMQKRIEWATTFFRRPNGYENLDRFHRRLLRDLLIYDAAAYEIVMAWVGDRRIPLEIGTVPGDTIEIDCDTSGIPVEYWQSYNVLHSVKFEEDELAYLQQNPCTWQPYGMSPIETAFVSVTADLSANKYNADYFSANGIPPALLAVLGVSEPEFRSLLAQMRSTKADNPWNIHAFRAQRNPDGSAQKILEHIPLSQQNNREMQFKELLEFVPRRICMAYKVSPSQIGITEGMGGGIGNGIAETQADLQQNRGVGPLLKLLADTHTHSILHTLLGWEDLEFAWEQSNTPQEEAAYNKSIQELSNGARTINEHRQEFGGRKAVDWGDLPLVAPQGYQPPATPEQLQQQMSAIAAGGQGSGAIGQQLQQQAPQPQPNPLQKSITIRW